ncbi:4-vinyl reductase [Myxococcota bacterium]|nr:4-vinyl reductase [Myxococcota bacterium]
MSRSDRFELEAHKISEDFLEDLGLGRDAPLLHEPKLFLDGPFLSALLLEFDRDLSPEVADQALFAIGAAHGARAAAGVCEQILCDGPPHSVQPLVLPMVLNPILSEGAAIGFEGTWPEAHEARARLAQFETASEPRCLLSAGYTSAWLSRLHQRDLMAIETECIAHGDRRCRFRALEREAHLGVSPGSTHTPLTLASTESIATRSPLNETASVTHPRLDPADEAVHVWGPVMVLPFRRAEDAKATLQVLSEDANTLGVRAVVVNVGHRLLTHEREFEMLVQTLEIIEQWGAEAILAGLSEPLSRRVDQRLLAPLLQRDSLPEAVASAFQIAEAQRYPL